MPENELHRFEYDGRRFVLDPETCFCFECDAISWDVLDDYPRQSAQYIIHRRQEKYSRKELEEVIGELEWLRSCKSILPAPKHEEMVKAFEIERGLKRLMIALPGGAGLAGPARRWFGASMPAAPAEPVLPDWLPAAAAALLGRSNAQKDLTLELRFENPPRALEALAGYCSSILKTAQVAGKNLSISILVLPLQGAAFPRVLADHTLGAAVILQYSTPILPALQEWRAALGDLKTLARWARAPQSGAASRMVFVPGHGAFASAVKTLHEEGFPAIEMDLDAALVARPDLDSATLLYEMRNVAVYYAQCLLKQQYFRLEPIASLFLRIYHGTPQPRFDPAGLHEWAVDQHGTVFPSMHLLGQTPFAAGSLESGAVDEGVLRRFDDVGALTTASCRRCWARNLCGGGAAGLHQALSGDWRQPHEPWCRAQRAWMEHAVAAFNLLSAQGVNFTRMYAQLGQTAKPSIFQIVRAAFRMSIGIRPIGENDAEWLTQWENWNDAAYFAYTESGTRLATQYDREMDSLHPRAYEQEMVLIEKSGAPFGLLRIRPERLPDTAMVWLYMREDRHYASAAVRKSFQSLLSEFAGQQQLRHLLVPVGPAENALADFLHALGFESVGALREALYLHGDYQPVRYFHLSLR